MRSNLSRTMLPIVAPILVLAAFIVAEVAACVSIKLAPTPSGHSVIAFTLNQQTTVDATRFIYEFQANSSHVSCDTVYYFGNLTNGSTQPELIGYKLSANGPNMFARGDPLVSTRTLKGEAETAYVVCKERFTQFDELELFVRTVADRPRHCQNGDIEWQEPLSTDDVCSRTTFRAQVQDTPSEEKLADASSAVINAVSTSLSSLVSDPSSSSMSFFHFNPAESKGVFRFCPQTLASPNTDAAESLVALFFLRSSAHQVVSEVIAPTMEAHIGSLSGVVFDGNTFASPTEIDFKCTADNGDSSTPSRNICYRARCDSSAVADEKCYYGTMLALDEECANRTPVESAPCVAAFVPAMKTEPGLFKVDFEMSFNADGVPVVVTVHTPGFKGSSVKSASIQYGDASEDLDASAVSLNDTSISVAVTTKMSVAGHLRLELDASDEAIDAFKPAFTEVAVHSVSSNEQVFSSAGEPVAGMSDAIFTVADMSDVDGDAIFIRVPKFGSPTKIGVSIDDTDAVEITCAIAALPSVADVENISNPDNMRFVPNKWTQFVVATGTNTRDAYFDVPNSDEYVIHCTGVDATKLPRVSYFHTTGSTISSIHLVDFDADLPIKSGFIAHVPFRSISSLRQVAARLNNSLSAPGKRSDAVIVFHPEATSVAMRLHPLASFLFPSVEVFRTAFTPLTGSELDDKLLSGDFTRDEFFSPVEEGTWQCGDGRCVMAVQDCANDYGAPVLCTQSVSKTVLSKNSLTSSLACAFDAPPADLPVSSGCGKLLCALSDGYSPFYVSCNDTRVCADGCHKKLPITEDLIEHDEAFKTFCVKNGNVMDSDSYCPSWAVPPPSYASTCATRTACAGLCERTQPCDNDGSRQGWFDDDTGEYICSDCMCNGQWSPNSNCSTCGLLCAHGTSVTDDGNCQSCDCPFMGGFFGELCECREVYLTFNIREKDLSFPAVIEAYKRIFWDQSDLSINERIALVFFSELRAMTSGTSSKSMVQSPSVPTTNETSPMGTKYFKVTVNLASPCYDPPQSSDMEDVYDFIATLKSTLADKGHLANKTTVLSAVHLPSGFSVHEPNCGLDADMCPSGWANEGVFVEDKGAGLSGGAIAGIVIGSAAGLILLALVLCYVMKIACFAGKSSV